MSVKSRAELKDYCLRELGFPVLEINVDDDQLEDRINEALEYWRLYHNEGIEKVYLKQKINASRLHIVGTNGTSFARGAKIIGETSKAIAQVIEEYGATPTQSEIICNISDYSPTSFVDGEIINSTDIDGNLISATLIAENAVVLGEIDKKYIELTDWVYGVTRVLPFASTQTSKSMFDMQYQLRLHDLYDLTSTSIIYYKQVMGHLALLDMELNGKPMFRFNRLQNRLYLDITWDADVTPGQYIMLECYRALDPTEFSRVWSELWLKRYTAALFKKQWGQNLSKFAGLQLPGGVTLNGMEIYQQAVTEIKELEDKLQGEQGPCEFFLG